MASEDTFIYVVGPAGGPNKVGLTADPQKRLRTLQTGHYLSLSVHHSEKVPWSDAALIERLAHDLLKSAHLRGEWFDISVADAISAINQAIDDVRFVADESRSNIVRFRPEPEELAALQNAAKAERRPVSQIVAIAVAEWLKRNGFLKSEDQT